MPNGRARGAHLDEESRSREAPAADALLAQALARHEAGDAAAAAGLYAAVLECEPGQASALHNLAVLRAAEGDLDEALALLLRAVRAAPALAQIHCSLASLYLRAGRTSEAGEVFRRVLALEPANAQALTGLGDVACAEDRTEDAQSSYEQALSADPNSYTALTNLGVLLMARGLPREAGERFAFALGLQPQSPQANYNVANALRAIGCFTEARGYFERAVELAPGYAEAWTNLGNLSRDEGDLDKALACHREAVRLKPGQTSALMNLGQVLRDRGDSEAAQEAFAAALAIDPANLSARLCLAMAQLPLVYPDEDAIEAARRAYAARLRELVALHASSPDDPAWAAAVGTSQPFYLAYQGRDDLELQRAHGELACRIMAERYPQPEPAAPARAGERIRVGIVSGFFSAHSNWKIPIRGWLSALDRSRFELLGFHTGLRQDAATAEARSLCDAFVQGPLSTEAWIGAIAASRPHVLIYPEIGMDPMCARLAALRLAAVQCVSWGHPDTSGYPTMDYYLSSDAMEPEGAKAFYSEGLERLPGLGVAIEPDRDRAEPLSRADLGYREGAAVYWCGQSLPKYLPRFDKVFPRIAEAVGDCQFVFIGLPGASEAEQVFRKRMADSFSGFGLRAENHCVFLPRLGKRQFLGAVEASDVFLDSLEWSGCNSTLESLAFDLPIATHRGRFMRGRHTAAILDVMGLGDLVSESVDDYIAAAIRLGLDQAWRASVRKRIAENKAKLWADHRPVAALEAFLEKVARA